MACVQAAALPQRLVSGVSTHATSQTRRPVRRPRQPLQRQRVVACPGASVFAGGARAQAVAQSPASLHCQEVRARVLAAVVSRRCVAPRLRAVGVARRALHHRPPRRAIHRRSAYGPRRRPPSTRRISPCRIRASRPPLRMVPACRSRIHPVGSGRFPQGRVRALASNRADAA